MDRGSGRFENITDTANRVNELGRKRIIHLRAQAAHDHVHDIGVGFEANVPNVLGDFAARDYFARRTSEMRQKEKLLWRQVQRNAGADRFVAFGINLKVVDAEQIFVLRRGASQQGTNPGEQFREGEWFDQIIVGPELKTFDSIADTVAGGEKKNRGAHTFAAQFLDHFPSILVRQHDIDDEQVELGATREIQSGLAIDSKVHSETGLTETFGQKGRGFFFVFDDEDFPMRRMGHIENES